MHRGAIILCGGHSSRMGRDKSTLPFGPELMLQRVVRLISQIVDPDKIVVVAASQQILPAIPAPVQVTHDERQDRGPLQGLAAGLRKVGTDFDAVYVSSCEVPLLVPAFVKQMFESLGEHQVAVPYDGQRHHPLAAVYRPKILGDIQSLLDSDQLRVKALFDRVNTHEVPVDELRHVDPALLSLKNLNHRDDYLVALQLAGFEVEPHLW